jgi:hypothetical protein
MAHPNFFKRFASLVRHRWMDASDCREAIPHDLAKRLMQRVTASEQRHSGEVRICVEAGLPFSYLWRHVWHKKSMRAIMRERALMMFGKLRIWDTENNNGVLIYLLLAEHDIELVADRGLNQHVSHEEWQSIVKRLGSALREKRFEDGLTQSLEEISALLVQYHPLAEGETRRNELANTVVILA